MIKATEYELFSCMVQMKFLPTTCSSVGVMISLLYYPTSQREKIVVWGEESGIPRRVIGRIGEWGALALAWVGCPCPSSWGRLAWSAGPPTLVNHPLLVDREKRDGKAEKGKRRPSKEPAGAGGVAALASK